jgi:hypothetical protein
VGVLRKMTAAQHAENSEEEGETTGSRVGWSDELYLPKRSHEGPSSCLQAYVLVWFFATMYIVWLLIPSSP